MSTAAAAGRAGTSSSTLGAQERDGYLAACRADALAHIETLVGARGRSHPAYRAVLEYPLREAKGLRPALAVATCRALGGSTEEITPTAAVFELLHNAFLVHDDVEDGSEMRRNRPTLAVQLGVPRAVHAGDTMLSMALEPLLDNMQLLDLGRALKILDLVATVLRRTVEGQALELTWIAEQRWDITPKEYVDMVALKTAWYTFAGPMLAGAIVAQAPPQVMADIERFAIDLGVAFQIRDDTLNLLAEPRTMGKEAWGDLWEGKRTLILALLFAEASDADRQLARDLLAKQRPSPIQDWRDTADLESALDALGAELSAAQGDAVRAALRTVRRSALKSEADVARLHALVRPFIGQASSIATRFASAAGEQWSRIGRSMGPSIHFDLVASLVDFAIARER